MLLPVFICTFLFNRVSSTSAEETVDIVLLHFVNSAEGSYIKLLSLPYTTQTYAIEISSFSKNQSDVPVLVDTKELIHDSYGLAQYNIRWPSGYPGLHVNITATLNSTGLINDTVCVCTDSVAHEMAEVYYPLSHMVTNVSYVKAKGSWTLAWDLSSGPIIANSTNPQLIEVRAYNASNFSVFCLLCASGISKAFGNYTLTLSAQNSTKVIKLLNSTVPADGLYTLSTDAVKYDSYRLSYTFCDGDNCTTKLVDSLESPARVKNIKEYLNGRESVQIYLNEIHLSTQPDKDSDKFWIEMIGPAYSSLKNYRILFTKNGKVTQTLGSADLSETTIGPKGFKLWSSANSSMALTDTLKNMTSPDGVVAAVVLVRDDGYMWLTLDVVRYVTNLSSSDCSGPEDQLNIKQGNIAFAHCISMISPEMSLSRCGISADMSVWYLKKASAGTMNVCSKPNAYIKMLSILSSSLTISSFAPVDSLAGPPQYLSSMGLMLTLWSSNNNKEVNFNKLSGASLSTSAIFNSDVYITLNKSCSSEVTSNNMVACGAALNLVPNNVYAVALVQYYDFLPTLTLNETLDQIVDAVVYSDRTTPVNLQMITAFTKEPGAGQIQLSKSSIIEKLVDNQSDNRQSVNWNTTSSAGAEFVPKLLAKDIVQRYLRINSVLIQSRNASVEIKLLPYPKELDKLYPKGFTPSSLCLTIQPATDSPKPRLPDWTFNLNSDEVISVGRRLLLPRQCESCTPSDSDEYMVLLYPNDTCYRPLLLDPKDEILGSVSESLKSSGLQDVIDIVKIKINASSTSGNEAHMIRRCYSDRAFMNPAFAAVQPGEECPAPKHLYIYKLCQGRIGIATSSSDLINFPTDYLYLYQYSLKENVPKITSLLHLSMSYTLLSQLHTRFPSSMFSLSEKDETGLALGWFPDRIPAVSDELRNNSISVLVVFPSHDRETPAKDLAKVGLETIHDHTGNDQPVAQYFKPNPDDLRRCLIRCKKDSVKFETILDYETNLTKSEDSICQHDDDEPYIVQYQSIRINEINADTKGWADIGEFVELKGPSGFSYASGLSISFIEIVDHQPKFTFIQRVEEGKKFDVDGYFLFERNQASKESSFVQQLERNKVVPNGLAAIALLWGASLIPSIEAEQYVVTDKHVAMEDLFLDVVIYAGNHTQAHSDQAKQLLQLFSQPSSTKAIQGHLAIEHHSSVSGNETISRCFCNNSWNMACFEMSYSETKSRPNICPTQHSVELTLCFNPKDGTAIDKTASELPGSIERFFADSQYCANLSCAVSRYQVEVKSSCQPSFSMLTFITRFPSEFHKNTYGAVLTPENLVGFGLFGDLVDCGAAICVPHVDVKAPNNNHKTVVVGAVVGSVLLVLIVIIAIALYRRRQKRLAALSARFEASNEEDDDDTFIPDGRISFSNPWYEKTTTNGANSANSRREYHKLPQ